MRAFEIMQDLADCFLPFLLDMTLKGMVVLGAAFLLTLVMRRTSAAMRHLVWSVAALSLLILPILSVAVPGWHVLPHWFSVHSQSKSTEQLHSDTHSGSSPSHIQVLSEQLPKTETEGEREQDVPPHTLRMQNFHTEFLGPIDVQTTEGNSRLRDMGFLSILCFWLWVLGFFGTIMPCVLGTIRLWRVGTTAERIDGEPWQEIKDRLSRSLGYLRPVMILRGQEGTMPSTWGLLRAKIMLPDEADRWPRSRLEAVLLHELAHLKRWDCLTQLLGGLACSMHWFNPLAWLAYRCMAMERERACDDLVIATGCSETEYADHLLHIVSKFRSHPFVTWAAISMGHRSWLERRLMAILDRQHSRRGLTHASLVTAVIVSTMLIVPLAALRPIANAKELSSQEQPIRHEVGVEQRVALVMKDFTTQKIQQMEDLSEKLNIPIPEEFAVLSDSIQANEPWADVSVQFGKVQAMSGQYEGGVDDPGIRTPLWSGPIIELASVFEHVQNFSPQLLASYADLLLDDIPDGSIFFVGTDWGRFITTAFRDSSKRPEIVILTPNGLADQRYMDYIRAVYGDRIKLPSEQDFRDAFRSYAYRVVSGEIDAEGGVTVKNGRVSIESAFHVFQVSAILAQQIFEMNKAKHPFYLQEAFVLEWAYPYLTPHGAIMRLNPEPVQLTSAQVKQDRAFWSNLSKSLLHKPEFTECVYARQEYASLRGAIAGIYQHHDRFDDAEAAYREALYLHDGSTETADRLGQMFYSNGRKEEAVDLIAWFNARNPSNEKMKQFFEQITGLNPIGAWRSSGWGSREHQYTGDVEVDQEKGYTRFLIKDSESLHTWTRYGFDIDTQLYPILVMRYRAENVAQEGWSYNLWIDDGCGPSLGGLVAVEMHELESDGEIHEIRKDLRKLKGCPGDDPIGTLHGPINSMALSVVSTETSPSVFELHDLRFEGAE